MKYEKLIRIPAKKHVWPEDKDIDFEAYDTKMADEAFNEVVNWFGEADTRAKELESELSDLKKEKSKDHKELTKTITDLTAKNTELTTTVDTLTWKNKELENKIMTLTCELEDAKGKVLTSNSNFNQLSNKVNDLYEELENEIANKKKLWAELDETKTACLEKDNKLKIERELKEKFETKLNTIEKTMATLSDTINFYNEWKKNEK